jgi:hypothetical protein
MGPRRPNTATVHIDGSYASRGVEALATDCLHASKDNSEREVVGMRAWVSLV